MASEPKCNSENPLTIDDIEELVATEFDGELLRELLEEPTAEIDGSVEQIEPGNEVNVCEDLETVIETQANIIHEFDWSEMDPREPCDTICSIHDYADEFVEFGSSGVYSHCFDQSSPDETTYVGLW